MSSMSSREFYEFYEFYETNREKNRPIERETNKERYDQKVLTERDDERPTGAQILKERDIEREIERYREIY